MKKRIISLLLALILGLSLTGTALAVSASTDTNSKETTITGFNGATVSFTDLQGVRNDDKVLVRYTGGLKAGEQYLVLMLSDKAADPTNPDGSKDVIPTANNILYIDQKAADSNGTIEFEVYPKSLSTGVILITGVDASGNPQKLVAAIIKAQYILGDVDDDGAISPTDAALVLRYAASLTVSAFNETAADVDGAAGISATDAALILRVAAGLQDFA